MHYVCSADELSHPTFRNASQVSDLRWPAPRLRGASSIFMKCTNSGPYAPCPITLTSTFMATRRPSVASRSPVAGRTLPSQELVASPESHALSLGPAGDVVAHSSVRFGSQPSASTLAIDTSSVSSTVSSYETCTNDPLELRSASDGLPGPGRLLGRFYDKLGQKLESTINRLAASNGPDAIANRLDSPLKKLLHHDFLMRLSDLMNSDDQSLLAMEALLGLDPPAKQSERKGSNNSSRPSKSELDQSVSLRVVQDCGALLQLGIKFSDILFSGLLSKVRVSRIPSRLC